MRSGFYSIIFFLLASCQVHNTIPKVDSNSNDYINLYDNIPTNPRYLDGNNLRIIYQESYNDQDGQLNYNIYDQKQNIVQSNSSQPITIVYGVNKLHIPLNNLATGIFVLEVINEKGVKKYLTFLKSV